MILHCNVFLFAINICAIPLLSLQLLYPGFIADVSLTGERGKTVDSSYTHKTLFEFPLGMGRVIKGWDEGMLDMCVGEKRLLQIPPDKGYGDRGAGKDIPGGSTLKFDVELFEIKEAPPQPNIFDELDASGDLQITLDEMGQWFLSKRQITGSQVTTAFESEDKDKVCIWWRLYKCCCYHY